MSSANRRVGQRFALFRQAVGHLAELTPSGRDQHHPMALFGETGHGAAGGDGFVVRMSMKKYNGCHLRHPTATTTPGRPEAAAGTDRRRSLQRKLGCLGQRQLPGDGTVGVGLRVSSGR